MLTKQDSKMAQGLAILGMVMLHLFCRETDLPYDPVFWIGKTPAIYYFGLFGDLCVPVYCFSSGYAQCLLFEKEASQYPKQTALRLWRFIRHYWIIVCLFSVVGMTINNSFIPGSFAIFLGNILICGMSYNGAWWFVLTYILLVCATPLFHRLLDRIPPVVLFLISGIVYFVAYLFRFRIEVTWSNPVISWVWTQMMLFGTSQFSYVIGMLFFRCQIMKKLHRLKEVYPRYVKVAMVVIPLVMFCGHSIVRSAIISPITGLLTMVCFHLWNKPWTVKAFFGFFGKHSTNIWLVHMFFYLSMFARVIFASRNTIVSLLVLLSVCILTSYAINAIENVIVKIVNRMLSKRRCTM